MSMYSMPTKSTSSAYAISLGIFSSNDDLGLPKTLRTSFRACSRYNYGKEHGAESVALGCTNIASERCVYISVVYSGVDVCVA